MKTNVHLTFEGGKCTEAFAFYGKVFNTKSEFKMTYGEAPPGAPVPEGATDLVMHMSMPLGSRLLMGCDIPPSMPGVPMGGFEISVDMPEESEAKRIFSELCEGGKVGDAADGFDLFEAGELVGQGNDVDGALIVHQVAHSLEDTAMGIER